MIVYSNVNYGGPEQIKRRKLEKPVPKADEVLVKISYSSVNRTDDGFLRAKPLVTRLFTGLRKPRYISLGCEFSGLVESVGSSVTLFKPNDRVFGFDDQKFGGHAEYKAIKENKMIEKVPDNIDLKKAGVALEGAHYAMFYIYKMEKFHNPKIFVHGATGAIGSAMVQILKAKGYYVEASSTTKHLKIVKQLGADKVIDWQKQDITHEASSCDVFMDAVGKSSYAQSLKILNKNGLYMSSELGKFGQNPIYSMINPLQRLLTKRNIKFPIPKTRKKEASDIAKLLAQNKFKPLIDRQLPVSEVHKAFEYVQTGQKLGNISIKVS
jgi:NADPH:quinone reductase-like Zn-dependent oxidoreductase